jgi:hypothetical protein
MKSFWNHRLLAHQIGDNIYFKVHEVHYSNKKPTLYSAEPVIIDGENIKTIKWTLKKMKKCLKEPILWAGERFPEEYKIT